MRIIVFSDTHGNYSAMHKILKNNVNAEYFIFLGDGLDEFEIIKEAYPDKHFYCVSGNCDHSDTPSADLIEIYNTKIFMTHGHRYDVKSSHEMLMKKAKELGANIVLYGHTHCRYYEYVKGVHVLNPGSASQPKDGQPASYAFIDITPCGIMCVHVDL